jgi:pyridoxal phosphate enzyme (YggS family)
MENRREQLAGNLAAVRARVARACEQAGRAASDVALLPVTKFFPASDAEILCELGCREFGESREQEASAKAAGLAAAGWERLRWHMIGQVQRKKARAVARWAYQVHSVDSAPLAAALGRGAQAALDAGERREPLRVLLQVSLDGDPARGGAAPQDLSALGDLVAAQPSLRLSGLMAVPPRGADADAAFARLAALAAAFRERFPGAAEISAGMTNDLECAVRHGSTRVRVGTAILGARPLP